MEWNGIKQNQSNEMMYQIVIVKCALAFYHCVEIAIVPGELKKKSERKKNKKKKKKKKTIYGECNTVWFRSSRCLVYAIVVQLDECVVIIKKNA